MTKPTDTTPHQQTATRRHDARLEQRHGRLELGDALVFTSYTPHRSGPNLSDAPRRVLYVTWNGASAGDLRDAYYEDKWRKMQSGNISMIKHWQGQSVE